MKNDQIVRHTWRVGHWTVTLSLPVLRQDRANTAICEWHPTLPDRALTAAEEAEYRVGLAAAWAMAIPSTH
jgi:hypothetical protein